MLNKLLLSTLEKFASSRTKKYEMLPSKPENGRDESETPKPIDDESITSREFQETVCKIVNTIYLIAAAAGRTVLVDNTVYSVSDYSVPAFAQGIIDAGHIYFNDRAANVADEVFCVKVTDASDVLTPSEFNTFWTRYNSAQPDDLKFTLNPVKKADFHTLSEVELAMMENGTLGEIGGTIIPGQVSQILGIKLNCGSVLKQVPFYSEKELIEWLLQ